MNLSEIEIQQYKERVLGVAEQFISFCDRHNLRYFGIAGTAIGAIRHGGFIPWDDDMDFVMPRPDYERMISLRDQIDSNLDLLNYDITPNYPCSYVKLCDRNSSLLISPRVRCMMGAFIDIFPLDGLPSEDVETNIKYFTEYLKIRSKAISISNFYLFKDYYHSLFRLDIQDILSHLRSDLYHLFHKPNVWFRKGEEMLKHNCFENSKYIAYFGTNYGPRVISPRSWFSDYFQVSFEGLIIRLPIGIDEYLHQVYGNYMELPPKEKQVTRHSYYYLNLERRVSFEEAKSFIKGNEQ